VTITTITTKTYSHTRFETCLAARVSFTICL